MTYELAQKLKDKGFPAHPFDGERCKRDCWLRDGIGRKEHTHCPELPELINACGAAFDSLSFAKKGTEHSTNTEYLERLGRWEAVASDETGSTIEDTNGHTPEEAVARLWLALNTKSV